jgi:flavin-dependent dehydrogenase
MENFDIVVIGAGPSGAVAASWLKLQGYRVLVLEKETFPRFQIGESLLPNCMTHLEAAGLLEAVKAQNFQIKSGAAFLRDSQRFEFYFDDQFTENAWKWTWQVKRADFDLALITETERKGVPVRFRCEVTAVRNSLEKQEVDYTNESGELFTVSSRFIIDASGYGRVLPRLFDLSRPSKFTPRGAVFSHLEDIKRSDKASRNIFVHSFNHNRSWIWAIPFSDGTTSVGIVGDQEYIRDMAADGGAKYRQFIQSFPDLQGRFDTSDLIFEPRCILGYSVGVKQMYGPGFVLAGNSTEFLDPIFSSGVTFATASGLLSAQLAHRQLSGEVVDWQSEYEEVVQGGIDVFRSYVTGWYNGDFQTIIFSDPVDPTIKKQICSVLAGYVWDRSNPFVKKHDTILATLAQVVRLREEKKRENPSV